MALPGTRSILEEAERALINGLYKEAEDLFSRAIEANPSNPVAFEGRSATRIQLQSYEDALQDAERAIDLDPDFTMGYFRLGVALQCLGEYSQSIVAFSDGITRDRKNPQLLNAIIEVSLLSPIKSSLEPVMSQLRKMRLDANPFVITSVIGQELLSHEFVEDAVQVLENAVAIGTRSLKLKGSVFSALSSALWSLGDTERAIHYMNEDLTVSRMLSDNSGECRAHGNLGAAYYSQGDYQLAKENHNRQLALAQTIQDGKAMASAFSSLGHVHTVVGDHQTAAESHKQGAAIFRNMKDVTGWCRQLSLVASAYSSLGDLDSALQWQLECLRVTTDEFNSHEGAKEEAKARVDLAAVYHKMQKYTEEISCLQKSVEISRHVGDSDLEAHALSSLGYIARYTGDLVRAQSSYERLLELALTSSDHSMEAKACANLGVIHHQIGDYEMALKLQARNLELSLEFRDVGSQGRAHGNIGNAYNAMGMFEQAIQHHLKELEISALSGDKASECSTHGNLAVAFQALNNPEKAFHHYSFQTSLASQIGDITNESRGHMNIGNFHSLRKEYLPAIEAYTKYLAIMDDNPLEKPPMIAKVCYNAGFASFSLREYASAINFYEKSLKISLEIGDTISAARTYCNLGLAWKACSDLEKALECQNEFLTCSNQLQSVRGIFKALGNIGDIYMSRCQPMDALALYQQQYDLGKQSGVQLLQAQAAAALGVAYRLIGEHKNAIELHTEELQVFQNMGDAKSEFRAHGHLGAVLTSLEEYSSAAKCYENQCYVAQKLNDLTLQSTALGNMGITSINLQDFERAIDFFERQLLNVENMPNSRLEKGKVLCNIGDCYEALQNYDEAIALFEEALDCASNHVESNYGVSLERVYRGLSSAYKLSNKSEEAFKFCRLRVEICLEIQNFELLSEAYGELGYLFTIMADFENALSCLKIQMKYADNFSHLRGDAACGLGSIYQILRRYKKAVEYHQVDLQTANEANNLPCQGRAHGNLGAAYESLHNHQMAVKHQEQHLFIADSLNDPLAKLTALQGVARNVLRLGANSQRAALLMQQALLLARELRVKEDEGRIILDLALTNWFCGDLENAELHFKQAKMILVEEFWKSGVLDSTMNISIHPNLCVDIFEELITCQSALSCLYINTNQHSRAIDAAEKLRKYPEVVASRILRKGNSKMLEIEENLTEKLEKYATQNDSVILYYSIQAGAIVTWVITPEEGLCGVSRQPIFLQDESVNHDEVKGHILEERKNLLCHLISELRDSLGLESPSVELEEPPSGENETQDHEDDIVREDTPQKIPDFNSGNDSTFEIFHRLITTQAIMSYSKNISTLGLVGSTEVTPSKKPPIYALYDLLIGKIQDKIQKYASKRPLKKLALVLEGDLFMVPFSLLKRRPADTYLSQQFLLHVVPSASDLLVQNNRVQKTNVVGQITRGFIIGNPDVGDITSVPLSQASEDEANLVGTLLKVEPITGKGATKEVMTQKIQKAECLHFACSVSEKAPYRIFLSPGSLENKKTADAEQVSSKISNADSGIVKDSNLAQDELIDLETGDNSTVTPEQIDQRSITMGDILNFDLCNAKVAVIGSAHLQDSNENLNASSYKVNKILTTIRSFLYSGVQTLLLPLWPVPETACKLVTQSFYRRLMDGFSASEALGQSLDILRNSEQFEHPSYWAGFVLIGQDVTLDPRNLSLFYALRSLVQSDPQRFHDTLRLVLHLMDKSLERMASDGNTSVPMYASQASISKKVQNVCGWRELFSAVGFELRQSTSGIPDAVFFPCAEAKEELLKTKTELISYLQLPLLVLSGLNRLFLVPSIGYDLKKSLECCLEEYQTISESNDGHENLPQLTLISSQKTWRAEGSSDILSALGFKVSQIGEENVMLHCSTDHHDDVETVYRLLSMFFGNTPVKKNHSNEPSHDSERPNTDSSTQEHLKAPPLFSTMIRGLPPSTRRSIAVDFNASFKSQSSPDSTQHLELPDHMTDSLEHDEGHMTNPINHESNAAVPKPETLKNFTVEPPSESVTMPMPKNFTAAPSSDSIVVPKPILPQFQPVKLTPDPYTGKRDSPVQDATATTHSIQRSKRFQFHGSGSLNATPDTLGVKVPRSPQKSPMFYRKTDDDLISNNKPPENAPRKQQMSDAQILLQESMKTAVSNINSSHNVQKVQENGTHMPRKITQTPPVSENVTHFVPIQSPDGDSVSAITPGTVFYPTPKRPGNAPFPDQAGSKFKVERLKNGSPARQPEEVTFTEYDWSKLKGERSISSPYIPAPSVARGMYAKSNPFDYTHIVDKLTRLSTSDLSESGQGHLLEPQGHDTNNNKTSETEFGRPMPLEGSQEYGKVVNYLQPDLPQISMATDLVRRSPHVGAEGFLVTHSQLSAMNHGTHIYSRSLDGAIGTQGTSPSPHKHSLSHADMPPPPYKHPDFVSSPRRGDTMHSRSGSHASQGSTGSHSPVKKDQRDQPHIVKSRKPFRKSNSNLSSTGSEGSQVSYQLETSNQGKTWYIHENQSPEPNNQGPSTLSVSGTSDYQAQPSYGTGIGIYRLATPVMLPGVIERNQLPQYHQPKPVFAGRNASGHQTAQSSGQSYQATPIFQYKGINQQGLDQPVTMYQNNQPSTDISYSLVSELRRERKTPDPLEPHPQPNMKTNIYGNQLPGNQLGPIHQQGFIDVGGRDMPPRSRPQQHFQPSSVGSVAPNPRPSLIPRYQAPGKTNSSTPSGFGYRPMQQYRPVRPPKPVDQMKTNPEPTGTNVKPSTKQKVREIAFV